MIRTSAMSRRMLLSRSRSSNFGFDGYKIRAKTHTHTQTQTQTHRNKSTNAITEITKSSSSRSPFLLARERLSVMWKNRNHQVTARDKLTETRCVPMPLWMTRGRTMEYSISELAGHASFILVAASYAVDDFLMLRVIAVAGSTSMLVFTYFHPHGRVLWLPFRWNLLFILINSYRIGRVIFDKFEVRRLKPEELKLHHAHFQVMDLTDFSKILRLGTIESFGDGEMVLNQGQMNPDIRLVILGELDVFRDGIYTYSLGEGNFMSEAGLHIGMRVTGGVQSSGSVMARGRCQCIRWNRTELIDLLDQEKNLKRSFLSALSWDIIEKLKGQRHLLMKGKVTSPDEWTEKRNAQSDYRYAGILKNILSRPGGLSLRDKDEIDNYRAIHHIDDKHHEWALKFCGWSLQEFEKGIIKKGQAEAAIVDEAESSAETIAWLSLI